VLENWLRETTVPRELPQRDVHSDTASEASITIAKRGIQVNCTCSTWRENIDKVNAPNQFLFARNPNTYKGYDGVRFLYCPWCGSLLTPSASEREAGK